MFKHFANTVFGVIVIAPAVWGCSSEPLADESAGTLEVPLVAVSGGVTYRVSGALEIVGGPGSSTLAVDLTGDRATQTVKLLPGAYSVAMSDGYSCSVEPADPSLTGCTFVGSEPATLVISAARTTSVLLDFSFHFEKDVEVVLRDGQAEFVLAPELDLPCAGACSADELCVAVEGADPSCAKTCASNADCGPSEGCFQIADGTASVCVATETEDWTEVDEASDASKSTLALAVTTDASGNVYTAGYTLGSLPGYTSKGGKDAFVEKRNPAGQRLWLKQLGTSFDDDATAIALDGSGAVLVVGDTKGSLLDTTLGSGDVYAAKLDTNGNTTWIRALGTSSLEFMTGVAAAPDGSIYVTGGTQGTFPGQSFGGTLDAFVQKLDTNGTVLWSRQWGGVFSDVANAVAMDGAGNALIAGQLGQSSTAGWSFIRKINASGTLVFQQLLGGDNNFASAVVTNDDSSVVVGGSVFGAVSGQQHGLGAEDFFLSKLDKNGIFVWTHQYGTDRADELHGLARDLDGNLIVAGFTTGTLPGATSAGDYDAFVETLDAKGNLVAARQFGTPEPDGALDVAAGFDGSLLVAGNEGNRAFVKKLAP